MSDAARQFGPRSVPPAGFIIRRMTKPRNRRARSRRTQDLHLQRECISLAHIVPLLHTRSIVIASYTPHPFRPSGAMDTLPDRMTRRTWQWGSTEEAAQSLSALPNFSSLVRFAEARGCEPFLVELWIEEVASFLVREGWYDRKPASNQWRLDTSSKASQAQLLINLEPIGDLLQSDHPLVHGQRFWFRGIVLTHLLPQTIVHTRQRWYNSKGLLYGPHASGEVGFVAQAFVTVRLHPDFGSDCLSLRLAAIALRSQQPGSANLLDHQRGDYAVKALKYSVLRADVDEWATKMVDDATALRLVCRGEHDRRDVVASDEGLWELVERMVLGSPPARNLNLYLLESASRTYSRPWRSWNPTLTYP